MEEEGCKILCKGPGVAQSLAHWTAWQQGRAGKAGACATEGAWASRGLRGAGKPAGRGAWWELPRLPVSAPSSPPARAPSRGEGETLAVHPQPLPFLGLGKEAVSAPIPPEDLEGHGAGGGRLWERPGSPGAQLKLCGFLHQMKMCGSTEQPLGAGSEPVLPPPSQHPSAARAAVDPGRPGDGGEPGVGSRPPSP